MSSYDGSRFAPPAPVARVTLRSSDQKTAVQDVLMLLDTGGGRVFGATCSDGAADSPRRTGRLLSATTATIALMRSYPYWDAPAALESAGVPIRCINASPLGEQGFTTEVEVNRKYADFDVTLMDAVGHYPQLERPAEFNEILLATLAGLA